MNWTKKRLASSDAAWKVIANQLMITRTYFPGGDIINFDSWMGYPRERRELLGHIKRKKIDDVVFVTGDIHTFVAGDVRLNDTDKKAVATEFVGGSVTSQGLGEGGGGVLHGGRPLQPARPPRRSSIALQAANPWVKTADFDHHGYGLAVATRKDFRCTLKRVAQIKKPGSKVLPRGEFGFRITRGRPSLLD